MNAGLLSTLFLCAGLCASAQSWEALNTVNEPVPRNESSLTEVDGLFYLIGGRGMPPVCVFDPAENSWRTASTPPIEIHHLQPVVFEGKVYILCAMTGGFPHETGLEKVLIYDPQSDEWSWGHDIPAERQRGAAGVVLVDDQIYVVGGIVRGHMGGFVNWFDRYDPKTGEWTELPDAPNQRDHFQAAYLDGKIYAAGGRCTSHETKQLFNRTVAAVDVYDLASGQWSVLPEPLPTPRAGNATIAVGQDVVVLGGESQRERAHEEVEAWQTDQQCWHAYPSMNAGRHGTGAVLHNNYIYTCAGTGNRGGGPNLKTTERLSLETAEFSSLFNGADLTGWSVQCREGDRAKNYWSVVDGCIQLDSADDAEHGYVWLMTDQEYADFHLKLEFQVYKEYSGNSGVQIRSRYDETDNGGWLNGPQLDIHPPNPVRAGLIYDETRGNQRWIYPSLEPGNHRIPVEQTNPKVRLVYGEGEWNQMEIIAEGTRIRCFVNGELASDFDGAGVLDDAVHEARQVGRSGHIALQLHANDRLKAKFRSIVLREL
ncbi:family 16 glycoside hydrolase [Coraliomargarita akajimensis]|uniref:Uncharacterized protein n=1 Tax=Coraliomargarita akajimensis (strain DSM 45221 / IAM 15411 / JCM 23193 / KCTC 12865 / 04OKA010-24) TaxID=583355 RepID=D5ELQ2_CORAD|nr:family 16 glycoside hydrolase [Coraliomargarita akajimensis]ADE53227.1 protein of unknown function DUF1080 [Coraliomargarita akajimensis DSM 45221]